jgi:hypothetical protein
MAHVVLIGSRNAPEGFLSILTRVKASATRWA